MGLRVSIFKIISIADWIFKPSFRLVIRPDTGWTWCSKRPVPSLWWKQVGARPLHADFIAAFVYNLEGKSALAFLRTSLIYNCALYMSNPFSPFPNNWPADAKFQPGVTELGRDWIVFGDFLPSCELWSVTVAWGELAPRLRQGWEQGSLLGWAGCVGARGEKAQKARCQSCSQNNLLFFLNLPPSAEAARRRWVHGAGTSVSATKQLLTALEPLSIPSSASWKALPCLCPSHFLLLLLSNCQALHRAIGKAQSNSSFVQDFLVCGSVILFF